MPSSLHPRPDLRKRAFALASQMDWFRGLRAAVALCVPLVLGDVVGVPNLGWASLGGFEAILSDTGGPYRSRMASLATLSIGGALGLFLGSIAGGSIIWALPVTILFCFTWSYLAVLGPPFAGAGLLVQVIFICGIGAPTANWHEALTRGLFLLGGGAWAALLSLFLGFGKRRHELAGEHAGKTRAALQAYTPRSLNAALAVSGIATVVTYVAYPLDPVTKAFFNTSYLWLTTPFTVLALGRFLLIVNGRVGRGRKAESPTQEMIRDVPMVVTVLLWVIVVFALVYQLRPGGR